MSDAAESTLTVDVDNVGQLRQLVALLAEQNIPDDTPIGLLRASWSGGFTVELQSLTTYGERRDGPITLRTNDDAMRGWKGYTKTFQALTFS